MTTEAEKELTGAAFDLANAGYSEMPDPGREDAPLSIDSDSTSLREAADRRAIAQPEVVVRQYTNSEGKPAAANESVTLARAARDYASATAGDRQVAESESSEALAASIDALRAEAAANDPEAPEFYGFERPEAGTERNEDTEGPTNATKDQTKQSAELDPDIARLMSHPQVRLALEEKIGEVERARRSYADGLDAAMQIAQVSFVSQFPELAGLPPERLPEALAQIAQQDPAKLARIQAIVAGSEQLRIRQSEEARRTAEASRHQFQNYAKAEDARLETLLKEETRDVRQAVAHEIMSSAKASGIQPEELRRLFDSEPLMRNATFQRMMYDAGKYRLMMKARDAAVARSVPPVMRPGMAASRSESEQSDMRSLSARLSSSGDLRDAVALYQARKSGRR
ncbi:hypothetical protein JQ554_13600 [Bradyrhizobium diazoefficiens]|nr:hypothetical protein [Bradyrhizobium diazoefficiens]MBR0964779.1 hypothetical protein [Bradyrhizobium diazoefficiens]MBR0978952.1 hypothetical protein [Bradyrhizobium diazoefficiens]MBR1006766.1 hypothetical protein [Bradyrhizobium diazoefficiens]MBR1014378.1 hypothetical protein [Bradyrhizobium diazoefficiens]MBR1051947.1 hypothetical protein [Bradyrhizobium diazoefficiens]